MLLCDITPVGPAVEQHKFTCVDCNHSELHMAEDHVIATLAA
jgi:hypothetical protein